MPALLRLKFEHLLFFIYFCAIFLLSYTADNDYYWHLKAGEFLAQSGAIHSADPFSFTFAGQPWVMHEWLFEYLIYHVHLLTGAYGVTLFTAGIVTLSIYIAFRTAITLGGSNNVFLVLSAIIFAAIFSFTLPRPQIFTFLFVALYLHALIGFKYRRHPPRLYLLPVIMLLWVNLHGGYIIGITLLVLFIFTELVDRYLIIGTKEVVHTPLRPVIITTALCILASLFNPYTYHHWIYPFEVISLSATADIVEWLSPDFHRPRFLVYLLLVIGYFFIQSLSNRRASLTETALPLFFILMSFVSRRHIPIALIVLFPFYALALKRFDMGFHVPQKVCLLASRSKCFMRKQTKESPHSNRTYLFNWIVLTAIFACTTYLHSITNQRIALYEIDHMPVDAVEFIKQAGIGGNVLNSYGQGGYLIYNLYPNSKVFIDGRLDMYGDSHYYKYKRIYWALNGWRPLLDSYAIDYVLVDNSAPINHPLGNMKEFNLIYRDRRNSIYVRNNEKFESILKKYGNSFVQM